MLTYFLFIAGFVILIKGADLLIDGASNIAKHYQVSDLVIGLTIVAFGTSAPELVVNAIASYQGKAELAIANVLGSNIANILMGIGVAASLNPLSVKKETVFREVPFCLLAAVVIGLLANDHFFDIKNLNQLTRIDGGILLGFFSLFFIYTIYLAKNQKENDKKLNEPLDQPFSLLKSLLFILLGLTGLSLGGDWIVKGAIAIASHFGMSQALIGITIIAIGTSLPEIVTCAVSALKGKTNIAIGNVIGSNIFNIFWVLGISATINPLNFDSKINTDVTIHLISVLLLFGLLAIKNPQHLLTKKGGFFFILLYFVYMGLTVVRG